MSADLPRRRRRWRLTAPVVAVVAVAAAGARWILRASPHLPLLRAPVGGGGAPETRALAVPAGLTPSAPRVPRGAPYRAASLARCTHPSRALPGRRRCCRS